MINSNSKNINRISNLIVRINRIITICIYNIYIYNAWSSCVNHFWLQPSDSGLLWGHMTVLGMMIIVMIIKMTQSNILQPWLKHVHPQTWMVRYQEKPKLWHCGPFCTPCLSHNRSYCWWSPEPYYDHQKTWLVSPTSYTCLSPKSSLQWVTFSESHLSCC